MIRNLIFLSLFMVASNSGQSQILFEEKAVTSGLEFNYFESIKMGGGAAVFDFDLDGDEDIYVVGGKGSDGLFMNDGNGHFQNVTELYGIDLLTDSIMTTSVVTGDIDNDGRREIVVGTMGFGDFVNEAFLPNILLRFDTKRAKYENIATSAGLENVSFCMGGHFFDANQDGLLDLYVNNYVTTIRLLTDNGNVIGFDHDCGQNVLYINQGNLLFKDMTAAYGLDSEACTLAATSSDIDWDGDPDLIIANDFGKWLTPNQLFRNDGPEIGFTDISETSQTNAKMYAMGIAVGDFDEDLDFDFYVTNIADNHLFVNQGQMTFENQAEMLDVANTYNNDQLFTTGWGAIFEDFNNDSYLDLFVANGYVYSAVDPDGIQQEDQLFMGSAQANFQNVSNSASINFDGSSRGALRGDFNLDGLLDLVTITNESFPPDKTNSIRYYENKSSFLNWIGFQLEGTQSNRDAYGAKVVVCINERKLLREIRGGDSHASQNSSLLHFGLGNEINVDSAMIFWPNGLKETVMNPSINQCHKVREGDQITFVTDVKKEVGIEMYPNPTRSELQVIISGLDQLQGTGFMVRADGQIVQTFEMEKTHIKVDLNSISPGLYTVIFQVNGQQIVRRVVIQ